MLFIIDVGKEGPEGVEVAGCVWVVFVVVALGTADRRPEPDARDIPDPVGLIDRPILLDLKAPFVRRLQQPVVGRGQHPIIRMLTRGRLDQVAGQLQQGEPVERQIVEEGGNHPITIGRGVVGLIAVIAHGVGIADEVEPPGSQPFGMPRRGEQPVNQLLVAVILVGREIGVDLGRRRRQPGQVKADPPHEGDRVGLGGWFKVHLFQTCRHKVVDPRLGPG